VRIGDVHKIINFSWPGGDKGEVSKEATDGLGRWVLVMKLTSLNRAHLDVSQKTYGIKKLLYELINSAFPSPAKDIAVRS